MKNVVLIIVALVLLLGSYTSDACSMYKITENGKTIVGNNEDWFTPNSSFWFEAAINQKYGVMYMGQLDHFAQGAINDAGLVFDGFANPELPIENSEGKLDIPMGTIIKTIMETMSTVEEVATYMATVNLSSLSSSQIVFVDRSGTYLIVEGDELIVGEESEKTFSNFYYSQITSEADVELENFQNGQEFLKSTQGTATLDYCGEVMNSLSSGKLFGTQYSTIYDLNTLKVRVYLFHDYSQFIEFDLEEELMKADREVMIADLFPEKSIGKLHYDKYNDVEHPTRFIEELVGTSIMSEAELVEMGFNGIVNMIGYEWLKDREDADTAIKVFKYGVKMLPKDADLYDSLGEGYLTNKEWDNAIINYGKSLALDPGNENAIEKIVEANKARSGK